MFAYANIKILAMKKGYDFRLLRCSDRMTPLVNDSDEHFGHKIDTVFPYVATDVIDMSEEQQGLYKKFKEKIEERAVSSIDSRIDTVEDNTIMEGHYIYCKYLDECLDDVKSWFRFPDVVAEKCSSEIESYRKRFKNKKLVSVHFRAGKEYRTKGFLLEKEYWNRAADKLEELLGEKPVYMILYDESNGIVRDFCSKHNCIDIRGSLVHDMCIMTMADANIVCNSSFSMMGAMLNTEGKITICPSTFPVPNGYKPADIYSDKWIKIPSDHDGGSYFFYRLKQRLTNEKIYYYYLRFREYVKKEI